MRPVVFVVPGKPVPKGRPRFGRGRARTPAATKAAERALWAQAAAHRPEQPWEGGVLLDAEFIFEPPVSWSMLKRAAAMRGALRHTSKPDLDNLIKLVKDGLKGLFWRDDAQVVRVHGIKLYGPEAKTRIELWPLPARECSNA